MSPDEQVAVDALIGMSGMPVPDLAVVVLDATALSRSLYLLSMVVELGLPTVVALTMNDLAVRNGCGVDAERLSHLLDACRSSTAPVLLAGRGCEPLHAGHGGGAGTTGHPHAHGGDLPRHAHALRQRPGHRCEKLASLRHGFAGPGILVLEDLDLWGAPVIDAADDMAGFFMAAMSRGAREAVNLIRQAVENPDVYVLASASSLEAIDPFFTELLFPLTCVDIDYPTAEERADIWMDIARDHPSIRSVSRDELVRLSANLPRYDIYMAAREAIEEATSRALWSAATFRCPGRTSSTSSPPTSRSIPPSTPSSSASSSPTSLPPWAI